MTIANDYCATPFPISVRFDGLLLQDTNYYNLYSFFSFFFLFLVKLRVPLVCLFVIILDLIILTIFQKKRFFSFLKSRLPAIFHKIIFVSEINSQFISFQIFRTFPFQLWTIFQRMFQYLNQVHCG